MRFGFNPRIGASSRAGIVFQLREALHLAGRLEFDVIEIGISNTIFDHGMGTVFGREFLDILQGANSRFHLHIFPGDSRAGELGIGDPTPYPRSLALRRLIHVIEFFEAQHPMSLYIIRAGKSRFAGATHLASLRQSLASLETLYPGLPIAIVNDGQGAVLSRPQIFLDLLDATPNLRFVLNTGLAWRSVDYVPDSYASYLGGLKCFDDRLAEIHWSNGSLSVGSNRPLHVISEEGLDISMTIGLLGRNPALVHLFETVGLHEQGLARERRTLYNARSVY